MMIYGEVKEELCLVNELGLTAKRLVTTCDYSSLVVISNFGTLAVYTNSQSPALLITNTENQRLLPAVFLFQNGKI